MDALDGALDGPLDGRLPDAEPKKEITAAQRAALDAGREALARKRAAGMVGVGVDEPGVNAQLKAMRHVVSRPETRDRTFEQKECRRWLKDDPKGFRAAKTALERAERLTSMPSNSPTVPSLATESAPKTDDGTARVMELLAEEWEQVNGLLAAVRKSSASPGC